MGAHEDRIQEWIDSGPGVGPDYLPWRDHRARPKRCQLNRVPSRAAGRICHLFGLDELHFFFVVDHSPVVVDIREQFPLMPPDETRDIARMLGVTHTHSPPGAQEPWVMTSDFRLTLLGDAGLEDRVIAVKRSNELRNPTILRRLAIESEYWTRRGLSWTVVTEKELPTTLWKNLEWLREAEAPTDEVLPFTDPIFETLRETRSALHRACLGLDGDLGLEPGSALALVRSCLLDRKWEADLDRVRLPRGCLTGLRRGRGFPLAGEW